MRTLWKNGRGATYEIATRNGARGMLWRLSLAEMAGEVPFSVFPGLQRILTVVSGPGICLTGEDMAIEALPQQPVTFSGDVPLVGACADGPVRNLNLIFDPGQVAASVAPVAGCDFGRLRRDAGTLHAIHLLSGRLGLAQGVMLEAGDTALLDGDDAAPSASEDARGLLVAIHRMPGPAGSETGQEV
ncbi:Protein Ves [Defluviimonas aquaemixtae]|uniref:Protein Ves n=1 Tax=Albidovulum aquaemixtae TaxID=1542388 RepID=A0A2R8B4S7_9RHOB|nr:HutD family protein [Defluviimonas aquaemixtae]SPH17503.1 Protein Ves [Defluviimonas aquaemixtae]